MDSSPLRQRDVRLIVGAVGISALGDFLLWIPLTLRIQEISDSGIAIAGGLSVAVALAGLALYWWPKPKRVVFAHHEA